MPCCFGCQPACSVGVRVAPTGGCDGGGLRGLSSSISISIVVNSADLTGNGLLAENLAGRWPVLGPVPAGMV